MAFEWDTKKDEVATWGVYVTKMIHVFHLDLQFILLESCVTVTPLFEAVITCTFIRWIFFAVHYTRL